MAGVLRKLRPLDAVIVVAVVAGVVFSSVTVYGGPAPATVMVTSAEGEWIYPLEEDRLVRVSGPLGESLVHIHDGMAHIDESPCRNQTCVASPPITRTGEWSACLPNGVFIRMEGRQPEDGIDAFSR